MLNFIILATLFGCAFGQFYDICQDKPFGVFIKDFTSCKSYIACAEKYSIYGDCPDGLMFDEEKGMCEYADKVKCNVCPPVGLQSFSIKGSCDKFVRCVNGVGNYMKCSAGLFFDQNLGSCNVRHEVDCEQDICESGETVVPSHEDCAAYFECNNGEPNRRTCKTGYYYNDKIKRCDFKDNVVCTIKSPKVEELDDISIVCPPTGIHYYPHPMNCSHYFICLNGVSAPMNCGAILKYDYAQKRCVLPHMASCIDKVL